MRPLLAPQDDPLRNKNFFRMLKYPMFISPKIDGIRGLVHNGQMMSRTFKVLANLQVQKELTLVNHLDMEITYGEPTGPLVMKNAQSSVRAVRVEGDFRGHVFDYIAPDWLDVPFYERLEKAHQMAEGIPRLHPVLHTYCEDVEQLLAEEEKYLALGYEGVMMRNPMAPYKTGRATMNESIIWKLKRFVDEEMLCMDVLPAHHNANEAKRGALGYIERSTAMAGKVESDLAGTYVCVSPDGQVVSVAPGAFSHDERRAHLRNPEEIVGHQITARYFGRTPDGEYRHPRAVAKRGD